MALNTLQQFQTLIEQAENILITTKEKFTPDGISSALSLAKFLRSQEKRFAVACDGFIAPKELSFLPGLSEVQNKLTNLRQFIITLDLKDKKVDEFSYDIKKGAIGETPGQGSSLAGQDQLEIYITAEAGDFNENDVKVKTSSYCFDLIITLDTPDLESLGKIYFDNPEFFFQTPLINIDHKIDNENYGQLNLVEPTRASVAEILYHLMAEIGPDLIDEEMATCLLTGLISKTESFKTLNVTPATLHTAFNLINSGADREKIVTHLYRNKTLATLKLWGRVLARLNYDRYLKMAWAVLPAVDFVKAGASEENLKGVVEEMISNSPQAEITLLLYEKLDNTIGGQLQVTAGYNARDLLTNLEVSGTKNFASFVLKGKTLKEAEAEVVGEIRGKLMSS